MSQPQIARRRPLALVGTRLPRDVMPPPLGPIGTARRLIRTIGRAAIAQAYEVGLMASVAATAPWHLAGGGFWPAVRALPAIDAHTAPTARPVLLVHGFGGAKSSWSFLARTLSAHGRTVDAMTYTPFGTSVEQLADRLVVEVERLLSQTGADKLHLVGHSLGGVVIAQAIAGDRLTGLVDTVVTLGAPFGGSPWANLLPIGAVIRALRKGSPLLRRLACAPVPDGVRWLAVTATLDVIVPGPRSAPVPAEVETVTVGGVGHLGMLLNQQVAGRIVAALPAQGDTGAHAAAHASKTKHLRLHFASTRMTRAAAANPGCARQWRGDCASGVHR
jgi:pimeloyl-ACP methyl ester carboxylesterase